MRLWQDPNWQQVQDYVKEAAIEAVAQKAEVEKQAEEAAQKERTDAAGRRVDRKGKAPVGMKDCDGIDHS